jgi:hypothetical protein
MTILPATPGYHVRGEDGRIRLVIAWRIHDLAAEAITVDATQEDRVTYFAMPHGMAVNAVVGTRN